MLKSVKHLFNPIKSNTFATSKDKNNIINNLKK